MMNNKKIGMVIIVLAIAMSLIGVYFRTKLVESYNSNIDTMDHSSKTCGKDINSCPHLKINQLLWPTVIWVVILVLIILVGFFLIFFEKSQEILQENQERIVKTLEQTTKQKDSSEKFELILSGLDEDEKKAMRAVREQDGITQATLRIRTGLSKTKLSVTLSGLEKKELIKKVVKGRTNQVFLKKQI